MLRQRLLRTDRRQWVRWSVAGFLSLALATVGLAGPLAGVAGAATPTGTLAAVSCSSGSQCVTVGSFPGSDGYPRPLAAHWNGTRWTNKPVPLPAGGLRGSLTAVSCPTSTFCVAIGQAMILDSASGLGALVPIIARWHGTSWQVTRALPDLQEPVLEGISCTSASFCAAVGEYVTGSRVLPTYTLVSSIWNGTQWTTKRVPAPFVLAGYSGRHLGQVSCSSGTHCVAIGFQASGLTPVNQFWKTPFVADWNGSRWVAKPAPLTFQQHLFSSVGFNSVSCPTNSACFLAETNIGTGFLEYAAGTFTELAKASDVMVGSLGISCSSESQCLAVGSSANGIGASWNGTTWTAVTVAAGTDYVAVSCPSASRCVAVGAKNGVPTASEYNGTSSVSQVVPTPMS